MITCLAAAAKNAMPTQKPATKFGLMLFWICMKRESKNMKYTTWKLVQLKDEHVKAENVIAYGKKEKEGTQ